MTARLSKHGTYRPNLAKLVASNSIDAIRSTTRSAFSVYTANPADYIKSLSTLSRLKGIGPATASLLLSSYDSVHVPFFSDELFRWLHWEEAKNKGWDRKINYTQKEYKDLYARLQTLRERLEKEARTTISALKIEKAAYALGKAAYKFSLDREDGEGDEALRPPSPKRRKVAPKKGKKKEEDAASDDDDIPVGIRRVEECRRKGLDGSPTYDELGFELDKEYIIKHTGGRPRPLGKRAEKHLDQKRVDGERKREMMFGKGADAGEGESRVGREEQWDDRVARDLGIAFHEVGMEEYEEWVGRGFKVEGREFENPSREERDRVMGLMCGSALRKGSKHR